MFLFIETEEVMCFPAFYPRQLNFSLNSSASSAVIKNDIHSLILFEKQYEFS